MKAIKVVGKGASKVLKVGLFGAVVVANGILNAIGYLISAIDR